MKGYSSSRLINMPEIMACQLPLICPYSNVQFSGYLTLSEFLRWYARVRTLILKTHLSTEQVPVHLKDCWLEIYLNLVVLEERIRGNVPAFEGLLLVKEHRPDFSKTL